MSMDDAASEPEITDEPERTRRHVLKQATIAPLDEDGGRAGLVGTLLFAIATVVVLILQTNSHDSLPYWYLWVALAGLGLGLIYLAYCHLRSFHAEVPRAD